MARRTLEGDLRSTIASDAQYLALESGDILYFPATPFPFSNEERSFLIAQKKVDASYHKNISYRPAEDRLKGIDQKDPEARRRMHEIMRSYSKRAIDFVASFLPRYAVDWRLDFASFRPNEEQGRRISHRSRNDLIHVDSFPSRPSYGDRLLRIFTNVHPERPRVWVTSDSFEALAHTYAERAGLPTPPNALSKVRSRTLRLLSGLGLPVVDRPEYDRFMLRFHHFMKEDPQFMQSCRKDLWLFPSGSTWMCFTDTASHSCISGQYALEQTFIVRRQSLAFPDRAPIAILERLAGFRLAPERKSA
jgi:hypothetical protein